MRPKVAVWASLFTLMSLFLVSSAMGVWWGSPPPKVIIPESTKVETVAEITLTGTWLDYPISRVFCSEVFEVGDTIYGSFTGTGLVDKYVVTLNKAKSLRMSIKFYSGSTGFIKWLNGEVSYAAGSTDSWISNWGSVSMPILNLQPGTYEFLVGFTKAWGAPVLYEFKIG